MMLPPKKTLAALTLSAILLVGFNATSDSAPAPAAASAQPAQAKATQFELSNGLKIVVIEDHRAPVVTHMLWFRVGGSDDPPGLSGAAHLFEHLMFKGTKTVPNGELSKTVARNGGQDNAFTTHDFTASYDRNANGRLVVVK